MSNQLVTIGSTKPKDADLDGFFARERGPNAWLLMLKAYIDESGHESKSHVFIAGHIGTEDQWDAFSTEWRKALGKRSTLHMAKLRWKKHQTRELLERLGPVPERCGLTRIFGAVNVSDYWSWVTGTAEEKMLKGYYAALYALTVSLLRWIPKNERVEIYLESQCEYEEYAGNILGSICSVPVKSFRTIEGHPKIANYGFITNGNSILLQQADYFVYALLQAHRDRKSKKAMWTSPILGDGTGVGAILTRQQVRFAIASTQAMLEAYRRGKGSLRRGLMSRKK